MKPTWSVWVDESYDRHVVANIDVPVMIVGHEPNPWHQFGDHGCPCQPVVVYQDPVSGKRQFGHKDPIH